MSVQVFDRKDVRGLYKRPRLQVLKAFMLRTSAWGLSLALSGSNQARKGRLVDALAARGDEGRDTLR